MLTRNIHSGCANMAGFVSTTYNNDTMKLLSMKRTIYLTIISSHQTTHKYLCHGNVALIWRNYYIGFYIWHQNWSIFIRKQN